MSEKRTNTSFEVFYNALSVGWHLRRIAEADPQFMADKVKWNRFVGWMERHSLKTWKTPQNKKKVKR